MADPSDPEHQQMLDWRGEYDSEAFNLEQVNRTLRGIRAWRKVRDTGGRE